MNLFPKQMDKSTQIQRRSLICKPTIIRIVIFRREKEIVTPFKGFEYFDNNTHLACKTTRI